MEYEAARERRKFAGGWLSAILGVLGVAELVSLFGVHAPHVWWWVVVRDAFGVLLVLVGAWSLWWSGREWLAKRRGAGPDQAL